jgi:hypothetical protein
MLAGCPRMNEELTSTRKFLMKASQLAPTIVPAEPGWENLGWLDGRLFSSRIIAWRIEMTQCEEHGIEEHVTAISADGFNSNCEAWAAYRDPAGRIFIQSNRIFKDEAELIAEVCERERDVDEHPNNRFH